MHYVKYWIFANLTGVVMFLYFASATWAPIGQEATPSGPGDPLIWVLFVLPILIIFTIVNLVWAIMTAVHFRKYRNLRPALYLILIVLLWSGVLFFDRTRQFFWGG